jgi:hypothetical protein
VYDFDMMAVLHQGLGQMLNKDSITTKIPRGIEGGQQQKTHVQKLVEVRPRPWWKPWVARRKDCELAIQRSRNAPSITNSIYEQ